MGLPVVHRGREEELGPWLRRGWFLVQLPWAQDPGMELGSSVCWVLGQVSPAQRVLSSRYIEHGTVGLKPGLSDRPALYPSCPPASDFIPLTQPPQAQQQSTCPLALAGVPSASEGPGLAHLWPCNLLIPSTFRTSDRTGRLMGVIRRQDFPSPSYHPTLKGPPRGCLRAHRRPYRAGGYNPFGPLWAG